MTSNRIFLPQGKIIVMGMQSHVRPEELEKRETVDIFSWNPITPNLSPEPSHPISHPPTLHRPFPSSPMLPYPRMSIRIVTDEE